MEGTNRIYENSVSFYISIEIVDLEYVPHLNINGFICERVTRSFKYYRIKFYQSHIWGVMPGYDDRFSLIPEFWDFLYYTWTNLQDLKLGLLGYTHIDNSLTKSMFAYNE